MKKVIAFLFNFLFLATPLIFFPRTSELFEFNKIVFLYLITTIIVAVWIARIISSKKIIFTRTILDIPFLLFLLSQVISTLVSIHLRTSIFGYYSRFNGGLLSLLSFDLLYWAFVSNMDAKAAKATLRSLLLSSAFVSVWAIAEHFGGSPSCLIITGKFTDTCWVQDVQSRVFATFGQPNWLAAYVVALLPLTWALALDLKGKKLFPHIILSILLFTTLLFTKSRSGFLGFVSTDVIFWSLGFYVYKKNILKKLILFNLSFLILLGLFGSPWTPSISEFLQKNTSSISQTDTLPSGTALETGGTESGVIRQIVWQGAIDVFKHNPIFGTGVETFAYSYFQHRPVEHNLTSEWDFLYNKAHNEYLNYLANTGLVGLGTYSILLIVCIYSSLKIVTKKNPLHIGLLAGFISLLITNFFGFSVVVTNLQLFLYPAFAISLLNSKSKNSPKTKPLSSSQKFVFFILFLATSYQLLTIYKYWYADILYQQGRTLNNASRSEEAISPLTEALSLTPKEDNYHRELSNSYQDVALTTNDDHYAQLAIEEGTISVKLNPVSLTNRRSLANTLLGVSGFNDHYLFEALAVLQKSLPLAPTDPKIYLNLGLAYARVNSLESAIQNIQIAIKLKPDYKDARITLALIYEEQKQNTKAQEELNYILENIDPNDQGVKDKLDMLKSKL